jgi:putative ubiquitin-RnfH superfamily antitoxin RatB of RatAB toxin-antitoxin module
VASTSNPASIHVEVAYALPEKQAILALQVPEGTSAIDAVRQSGIERQFEGLDIEHARLGIFGKVVGPQTVLRDGDRVEIYRPLIADPKEVRKARAARARERRQAD